MAPVLLSVQSLANSQIQQSRGPLGNSQHPLAKRCVSVLAGESDMSRRGCSVPCTVQDDNSAPCSSPNNCRVPDIPQRMAFTLCATLRWWKNPPAATPGSSSCSTPATGGTLQTASTRRVASSPASGIATSPNPFSSLEILSTSILNPEARAIVTNPLYTIAIEKNRRQVQWKLQPPVVSTAQCMVSGSRSIQQFAHWDKTRHMFKMGRLLELYMWNRRPLISASEL